MTGNEITVSCEATDAESGINHYQFFVSVAGSDYMYLGQNTELFITFTNGGASNYNVYAVALDNVGNVEVSAPAALFVDPTGINTVSAGYASAWTISKLNGTVVASGQGQAPTSQLKPGVFIVRQGNKARKIIVH